MDSEIIDISNLSESIDNISSINLSSSSSCGGGLELLMNDKVKDSIKKVELEDINSLENEFEALAGPYSFASQKNNLNLKESTQKLRAYQEIWISYDLRFASGDLYQIGLLKNTKAFILLKILDFFWTEHIERMGYIRETINWRAYGQQNDCGRSALFSI